MVSGLVSGIKSGQWAKAIAAHSLAMDVAQVQIPVPTKTKLIKA